MGPFAVELRMKQMRFLSLFSGIEAASVAWNPLGWQCAGMAEIEKFPSAILKYHYPEVPNLGDITKITEGQIKALGQIDLIVGGFPCQDLSVAGQRKGMKKNETRSGLFYDAIRLVRWAKKNNGLRWLLLENVPGIYSSAGGRDFAALVNEILGTGFDVPRDGWENTGVACGPNGLLEWATLDAQWFGLAQRRLRMFALADFGDWPNRGPVLLESESLCGNPPPRREAGKEVAGTLSSRASGGGGGPGAGTDEACAGYLQAVAPTLESSAGRLIHDLHGDRARKRRGERRAEPFTHEAPIIAHTLRGEGFDASEDGTGRGVPLVPAYVQDISPCLTSTYGKQPDNSDTSAGPCLIAFSSKDDGRDRQNDITPTLRSMNHDGSHANGGGQMAVAIALRGREGGGTVEMGDDKAMALRASQGGGDKPHVLTSAVRRLTPRECERLMGCADDYTAIPGAKDGPRYKALGNSMAVPVMAWIGQRIQKVEELL